MACQLVAHLAEHLVGATEPRLVDNWDAHLVGRRDESLAGWWVVRWAASTALQTAVQKASPKVALMAWRSDGMLAAAMAVR